MDKILYIVRRKQEKKYLDEAITKMATYGMLSGLCSSMCFIASEKSESTQYLRNIIIKEIEFFKGDE